MTSKASYSHNLDSKGKFLRVAQHPEATGMVPAVFGLLVMDVLHSTSYPPNNGISPRTFLKPPLSLRERERG